LRENGDEGGKGAKGSIVDSIMGGKLDLHYKIYITMKFIFFGGAYFVLYLDLIYPLTDFSLPLSPSLIQLQYGIPSRYA
jgi:hypothetical protein